jgi:quercetin dioxygenase-like cupin family protein
MAILSTRFSVEYVKGRIYTFEKTGDTLPMHSHSVGEEHITIVYSGHIRVHGDGINCNYGRGAVINFLANQNHEFIALADNTRIANIDI